MKTSKNARFHYGALATALSVGASVVVALVSVYSLGAGPGVLEGVVASVSGLVAAAIGFYFGSSRERRQEKIERRQVFIVHAAADADRARLLADAVREAGYFAWLDSNELTPGKSITDEIDTAIRQSAVALYIPPSGPSRWVERELEQLALSVTPSDRRRSPVVPVIDDSAGRVQLPEWLSDVAPLSTSDPDWRAKLSRTLDAVFMPSRTAS